MNWGKILTYHQIERALLLVWDNLMRSKKGSGEEVTRFPGVGLDLYHGTDLIGTGIVGPYKPPPKYKGTASGSGGTATA